MSLFMELIGHRARQTDNAGQAGSRNPSPVSRIPQATFQDVAFKSTPINKFALFETKPSLQSLPPDMLVRMAEIVHHMQKRQYQKANDSYLRLSIGNAPWPIGVTMVGIHERSAREKISSDQVAHVLNDEVSRKYIQSLKRLLTFSQTKYPPEDVSQLMG
ncbi:hypothetical protein HYDPIDRAFT_166251 [Hydnomerulius pinastri MD-312]|nr:hypothetical protein HYDPIDRAFT_166251 [Hydnomerulius pinastri MD-312]